MGIVFGQPLEPMVGDPDEWWSPAVARIASVTMPAMFPATRVRLEMLESNPAPGTEADPPMTSVYDFATGDFEVLGPAQT